MRVSDKFIMKIASKAKYLGQCDILRKCGNEELWQKMMEIKLPISIEEFALNTDFGAIFDSPEEGTLENLKSFISDDSSSGFYKSLWGNKVTYFFQTKGFEFIFIKED